MVRILSAALVGAAMFVAAPASAAAIPAANLEIGASSTDVGYYAPRRRSRCYFERRRIRTAYGYEYRNVRICPGPRRDYY